jgi:hypothetical protein
MAAASAPVHGKPVEAQLPHGIDEFVKIDGLANVRICAQVIALHNVPFLVGGCQDHDRKATGSFVASDSLKDLQTA